MIKPDATDEKTIVGGYTNTLKIKIQEAADAPPAVVLLTGPSRQIGKQWQILKTHMIVGRAIESDIFIDDKSISRKHAQIIMSNGLVFIEDLGSSNGTFLGGQRLSPQVPVLLKDNDQVKAGSLIIFKFLAQGNVETISSQEIYNQNQLDSLTQIHNKGALTATAQELFKRAKLTEIPFTVVIFDLDHFKKVNDTYDHLGGDFVLKELCLLVKDDMIRKEDFFARFGGEEFCLLLFGGDLQKGIEVAERIRQAVESHNFDYQNQRIPVTISLGVAALELNMDSWEDLFALADRALYQSKNGVVTVSLQPDFHYFADEELEELLRPLGHSLTKPADLARTVQKLSDFYIAQPDSPTPWKDNDTQVAYLVYFLPLGLIRWRTLLNEGLNWDFFNGLHSVVDFGSGPGTAALVIGEGLPHAHTMAVERSREASEFHQRLFRKWPRSKPTQMEFQTASRIPLPDALKKKSALLLLSYVLTEQVTPPAEILQYDSVIVMEPSTHQDGRRLMEWREMWIQNGFHIWAPCTHQSACPLLHHSKKDWCHDRVIWERPDWWLEMEKHLPFKNKSVTFSYVMMSRRAPPLAPVGLARLVGDPLPERGKTRQMMCRGPEREFLSWLAKEGPAPEDPRGVLVQLKEPEIKGAEVRAKTEMWTPRR